MAVTFSKVILSSYIAYTNTYFHNFIKIIGILTSLASQHNLQIWKRLLVDIRVTLGEKDIGREKRLDKRDSDWRRFNKSDL